MASEWDKIEQHLKTAIHPGYGQDSEQARKTAIEAARRTVLDLERQAAERDTLRQLLVDEGVKNAQLSVEIEQMRVRLEAAEDHGGPEPV